MLWVSIDWDWVACGESDPGGGCGWSCCGGDIQVRAEPGCLESNWRKQIARLKRWCDKLQFEQVIVAECHASIYRWLSRGDAIINIDSHDDQLDDGELTCASWASLAKEQKGCSVRWIKHCTKLPSSSSLNTAVSCFVALSSPWTPSDLDSAFVRFVCGLNGPLRLYGHRKRWLERLFARTQAHTTLGGLPQCNG